MKKSNLIVAAAVSGIIGAALISPATAFAAEAAKGHCLKANACKGKGDCGAADKSHDCAGKNACKGQGWTKATEKDCKKLMKTNKDIKWEKA